jgi:hypothetical protein
MTWATEVTEKATKVSGLNVSLFAQMFSPEMGTLVWSAFVPDLPTLEAANDKLLVDDGYISTVDAGAKFALGSADDALMQIVHGEVDPARQTEYATTVQTVCANGSVARGMELGIEIAQRVEKVIGLPELFLASATGSYGAVGWLTGYADIGELERSQQKLAADTKFVEFIDKNVAGVYVESPSDTQQIIYRRIV